MADASRKQNSALQLVFPAAVLCLFLSGVAGLVYQVVWTRYLALFTGHTSYAIVVVLTAFMGGLALGNIVIGRVADGIRRPLAFYGWLEILIGVYALAFPEIFDIAYGAYLNAAEGTAPGGTTQRLLKAGISFATVIIPTILMGGTLPVLARMATRTLGELRDRVSTLYFINSLGAALGVAVAEFYFVPVWGLGTAVFAGAAMNLAVGALALFMSGYIQEERNTVSRNVEPATAPEQTENFTPAEIRLASIGIALSGAAAMLYEIAWTRMLGLALGSSSNAFAIMLITFITGIAIGSWLIGRVRHIRNSMDWFAWMEIGIGVSIGVMMFGYSHMPYWFARAQDMLARKESAYVAYQFVQALICFGIMIVPTIILGMTLPLVSRISTAELARTGRSVGSVFSLNTLGAVLGTIVTGLWALPTLGLARTFALGVGVNVAIGVVILLRNAPPSQRKMAPLVLPGTVLWMIFAGTLFHNEWSSLLTTGAWRLNPAPTSFEQYRATSLADQMLFHRDGPGSTVTVKQSGGTLFLQVNAKTDASTDGDMATQLLLGHVPALLHENPTEALVIGLGSGVTCGALLSHTNIARLDVVEISPDVAEGVAFFAEYNDQALQNPRLNLVIDDAKSFLQTTTGKYDIIVSEPSNPWMAGVPGLFSVEFYNQCANRLKESGVMCQWLHIYDLPEAAVRTVLATFTREFPYASVWSGTESDLLIIGGRMPIAPDLDSILSRMSQQGVRANLARQMLDRPLNLLLHQILPEEVTPHIFSTETLVHSDYYPVLDSLAQIGKFTRELSTNIFEYDSRLQIRPNTLLAQYLAKNRPTSDDLAYLVDHGRADNLLKPRLARSICLRWKAQFPDDPTPALIASGFTDERRPTHHDVGEVSRHLGVIAADPQNGLSQLVRFSVFAMDDYRYQSSVFNTPQSDTLVPLFEKMIDSYPSTAHAFKALLAELAWDSGDMNKFLKLATEVFVKDADALRVIHFPPDDKCPAIVLERLISHYINTNDEKNLIAVVSTAARGGFLPNSPRLQAAVSRASLLIPPPAPQQAAPPAFTTPAFSTSTNAPAPAP
jgi:spermidine synthase